MHCLRSGGRSACPAGAAYPGTGIFAYNNFTSGIPVYGSIVQFFYTVRRSLRWLHWSVLRIVGL